MRPPERGRSGSVEAEPTTEGGPALRDAGAAAARAARDEADAADARQRLAGESLGVIEADDRVRSHLLPDEAVHAVRPTAILLAAGDKRGLGYGGTLYLTSQRLLHIGQVVVAVNLIDIVEASLAGERLLIAMHDAEGIGLDIDRPRRFRTELAAAIRAARA